MSECKVWFQLTVRQFILVYILVTQLNNIVSTTIWEKSTNIIVT